MDTCKTPKKLDARRVLEESKQCSVCLFFSHRCYCFLEAEVKISILKARALHKHTMN